MTIHKLFENFRNFVTEKSTISIEQLAQKAVEDLYMEDPMDFGQESPEQLTDEAIEHFSEMVYPYVERQVEAKLGVQQPSLRENTESTIEDYISGIIDVLSKENPKLISSGDIDTISDNVVHVIQSDVSGIIQKAVLGKLGSTQDFMQQ